MPQKNMVQRMKLFFFTQRFEVRILVMKKILNRKCFMSNWAIYYTISNSQISVGTRHQIENQKRNELMLFMYSREKT